MSDRSGDLWIDELERDLGQSAVLTILSNCGGQRRDIPKTADGSKLAHELGDAIAEWLTARFGGTAVDFPSLRARQQQDQASRLRAAILDAGLTEPSRSANVIAQEFGVTAAWVHKLRTQMRREYDLDNQLQLPFDPPSAR
ncbi:MAG: hypothetical protein IE938_19325 [Pseudomonas balearica]|nr:hypothetical protein [Stutzerimonas balearica]